MLEYQIFLHVVWSGVYSSLNALNYSRNDCAGPIMKQETDLIP